MTPLSATLLGGLLTCMIGGAFIWFFLPEKKGQDNNANVDRTTQ